MAVVSHLVKPHHRFSSDKGDDVVQSFGNTRLNCKQDLDACICNQNHLWKIWPMTPQKKFNACALINLAYVTCCATFPIYVLRKHIYLYILKLIYVYIESVLDKLELIYSWT